MSERSPLFSYKIKQVARNQRGTIAYALNIPAVVKEKFGDAVFNMFVTEDRIIFILQNSVDKNDELVEDEDEEDDSWLV